MSAYRVSERQIAAIVAWHPATKVGSATQMQETCVQLGTLLESANRHNLDYLYGLALTQDEREPISWGEQHFAKLPVTEVAMLKLVDNFEYQCSDVSGWTESAAFRVLEKIRDALIDSMNPRPQNVRSVRELPSYNAAPWGLYE